MAKKKLSAFQKRILLIIGLSFLLIGILIFVFSYLYKDIKKTVQEVNGYKEELERRKMLLERIQTAETQLQEVQPYLLKLKQAIPTETEVVNLESQLKSLALKYNLQFSFRFGSLTLESNNEPKNYSFNLSLSGTFDNIIRWMEEVNKLFFSLRFEKIEFNQLTSSVTTRIKKGNQVVSQIIPANYEVKILGKIYLR